MELRYANQLKGNQLLDWRSSKTEKRTFLPIYEMCWKSIKTKAVFANIEMNNDWNITFLQNSPLGI